jgi:predicted membrane chloride channel (bestrophin family)
MRDLQPGEDLAVLQALLPPREAQWVGQARSRPLHLLGAIRRVLHDQLRAGRLHGIVYRKLEEDLKELDLVVGGCERLYSSPVPPTMSRHAIRSIALWLLGLPFVLAGSMPPLAVALWTFATSYIFVGIEETGAQVENPFDVLPMTRLCNVVIFNIEEAIALPP